MLDFINVKQQTMRKGDRFLAFFLDMFNSIEYIFF